MRNEPHLHEPADVPVAYPPARRDDLVDVLHGRPVPDPYRWLEDADAAETQAWSAAQDRLLAAHAATWPGRATVRSTLERLLATGSVGVAARRRAPGAHGVAGGTREVLTRREPTQEHAVLLVRERDAAGAVRSERVLVDPLHRDPSGATTLDAWSLSREGDLLAYQLSEGGSEESVLRVLDVATGEDVDGPLGRARYSPVAWLPRAAGDPARFYYVRRLPPEQLPEGERQYHRRVYLRTVGADDADVEVFGDGLDLTNYYGVGVSHDGRWLVVSASAGTAPRTDVWLADLTGSAPEAPAWRAVAVGLDAEHGVWVGRDGRLYVLTDLDAPRGRLCVADPARPTPEHWAELVAEDPTAVLTDVAVLDHPDLPEPRLLVQRTRHAMTELAVHRLPDGRHVADVPLPGVGSGGALVTALEDRDAAWFTWTDHTTPARVLRLDGHDLSVDEWEAPPGAPPPGPEVRARQVQVTSADGTTVRAVVLARADAVGADGLPLAPAPAVLYGYGGFGISLTPGYSASTLAWVRAGGVWVVANLRGGGEEGEQWHRAGYRDQKERVYEDYEAVADALVRDGWTSPAQLALQGGSNGGLLVGAALTRRPDAYAAVVCSAPLLDMVRYELHGLGVTWKDEYGSAEVPEELDWLLGYSPYHRAVAARGTGVRYPATLFTVFDGDSRVDPLHARKTAAAMQAATLASPRTRPVLLRRERDVGHGARSLSRTVGLATDTLLFLAHHTGLRWSEDEPTSG